MKQQRVSGLFVDKEPAVALQERAGISLSSDRLIRAVFVGVVPTQVEEDSQAFVSGPALAVSHEIAIGSAFVKADGPRAVVGDAQSRRSGKQIQVLS